MHLLRHPRDQHGQGMTEYIIIVALIAVAAIGVFMFFGRTVREQGAGIANEISGQSAATNQKNAEEAAKTASTEAKKNKGLAAYDNASAIKGDEGGGGEGGGGEGGGGEGGSGEGGGGGH